MKNVVVPDAVERHGIHIAVFCDDANCFGAVGSHEFLGLQDRTKQCFDGGAVAGEVLGDGNVEELRIDARARRDL